MEDKCIDKPKEIYEELKDILDKLDNIINNQGAEDYSSMVAFKKEYDRLLKVLEDSKNIANCPVPAIKFEGSECKYMSPLEPLTLSAYAGVPSPDEPYTIIDSIRRQARNMRLDKIRALIYGLIDKLGAYVRGVTECKVDLSNVDDEDIDSMMLQLGLNPDKFSEGEEKEQNS